MADHELDHSNNHHVTHEIARQIGSNTVTSLSQQPDTEPPQITQEYAGVVAALKAAGIGIFDKNYFRIPFDGDSAILEVLAIPMNIGSESGSRDMLRVIFSSQTIDTKTLTPLTVVEDFLVDYAKGSVYSFEGAIDGTAAEGATLDQVTWNVFTNSPPHTEFDKTNKTTDTVFNRLYEQSILFAIDYGLTINGAPALAKKLVMPSEASRERVNHFTEQRH